MSDNSDINSFKGHPQSPGKGVYGQINMIQPQFTYYDESGGPKDAAMFGDGSNGKQRAVLPAGRLNSIPIQNGAADS